MTAQDGQARSSGPDVFVIAGESSGDQLGAHLIDALRAIEPGASVRGVGGPAMEARGFRSLFAMSDIAVMGFVPVVSNLPRLLRRIGETADAILSNPPDILVLVDSPDFTHRVARRVRARNPEIPIVNYVSPTVWAWRPGRARRMRAYIDHVMALLPFEPQSYRDLDGPPCTYTGHPLIERLPDLRGADDEHSGPDEPTIVVLPGSRRSEVQRLMPVFGGALGLLKQRFPKLSAVLPAVPHLSGLISEMAGDWPQKPHIVLGEAAKYAAFKKARAALAASGTVTLELALARTPTVLAYKVSTIEAVIAPYLLHTQFIGLPNIIAGRAIIPEFIQNPATPNALADALGPLIGDTPERAAQLAAFADVEATMALPAGETPSELAARTVLDVWRGTKSGEQGW